MNIALLIIGLVLGSSLGVWLAVQARMALVAAAADSADAARQGAECEARLREQLARTQAAAATDDQMLDAFRSVSQEALAAQSAQLLHLAEAKYGTLQTKTDTVLAGHSKAVGDGLQSLAEKLAGLEKERAESTSALKAVVGELTLANEATRTEAANLAGAMRDNRVRGVWGEVQLRRVLEIAGLDRHADFIEQRGVTDGDARGRPDVIVSLPNGRCVVIDSKVPLDRYLEAANATDPDAQRRLQGEHAKAVASHVTALSNRDYAGLVPGAIDFVLLFVPGDSFLSVALDADPALFAAAAKKDVLMVTPSSLVPLLRGIAVGWQEQRAEQAAREIQELGRELHERIAIFAGHFAAVGYQLDKTVEVFNKSVGSLDTRVVSTARKLSEHGAGSARSVPEVIELSNATRPLRVLGSVEEPTLELGTVNVADDASPTQLSVQRWAT